MKTVAQWAEQLPELIRIEFVYEAEKQEVSNRILVNPSATINAIIWIDTFLGTDFWHGVASCFYETPKSADYIDESVPYTKSEVDAMILEYADPNDEVCKVMLANVMTKAYFPESEIMDVRQNLEDNFKPLHETKTTTMDGFYSKIKLEQENEALKSTIEGLNAIVETHVLTISSQNEIIDRLQSRLYELEQPVKTNPETNYKPSLLQRFINWIS